MTPFARSGHWLVLFLLIGSWADASAQVAPVDASPGDRIARMKKLMSTAENATDDERAIDAVASLFENYDGEELVHDWAFRFASLKPQLDSAALALKLLLANRSPEVAVPLAGKFLDDHAGSGASIESLEFLLRHGANTGDAEASRIGVAHALKMLTAGSSEPDRLSRLASTGLESIGYPYLSDRLSSALDAQEEKRVATQAQAILANRDLPPVNSLDKFALSMNSLFTNDFHGRRAEVEAESRKLEEMIETERKRGPSNVESQSLRLGVIQLLVDGAAFRASRANSSFSPGHGEFESLFGEIALYIAWIADHDRTSPPVLAACLRRWAEKFRSKGLLGASSVFLMTSFGMKSPVEAHQAAFSELISIPSDRWPKSYDKARLEELTRGLAHSPLQSAHVLPGMIGNNHHELAGIYIEEVLKGDELEAERRAQYLYLLGAIRHTDRTKAAETLEAWRRAQELAAGTDLADEIAGLIRSLEEYR